ncbi:hypothetical protein JW756_04745 [Candidatus Woesearchaeota archaeon]|nr:hypothetical protein [Candidatus Woesearchaeota archaeon]
MGGGGGGAGGGIFLAVNTITGAGSITADGGDGAGSGYTSGAGGGGRIAIYYTTYDFTGAMTAQGGSSNGADEGGAGTIYLKSSTETYGGLMMNNYGSSNRTTNVDYQYTFDWANVTNATINGTAIITIMNNLNILPGTLHLNNPVQGTSFVDVQSGAILTHAKNNETKSYTINITCTNLTIRGEGSINLTGKGYGGGTATLNGNGPGAGTGDEDDAGGGGGYGGAGGAGGNGGAGGASYDSITNPLELGSGGGGGNSAAPGGDGGGAVLINATGTINIIGNIATNGKDGSPGTSTDGGGGGAAGSIYLITNTITGSGNITAQGGNGGDDTINDGGGGAGGRISINYITNSFTGIITSTGGTGNTTGGNGTVFWCKTISGIFCPGLSDTVVLDTLFTPNSSTNVNRTIAFAWNKSFVKWNDTHTGSANFTITGLNASRTFYLYNNSVKFDTKKTDASGNLAVFNMTFASEHEVILSESPGSVCNSTSSCFILRASGSPVAVFDKWGALDIKGNIVQSSTDSPGANDFIVRNSTGAPVAWVDDTTGNITLLGAFSENNDVFCTPPEKSFIIVGNNSECVAYVNETGDLWIRSASKEKQLS